MLSLSQVTQRDVAEPCKVHPSTICLALKDSPSIPLATRVRIQAEAARMGYRPNAAARNLAYLRTEKTKGDSSLPLAWLNQEPQRDYWRVDPVGQKVFAAAKRHAAGLGYVLTDIWAAEPGMRSARLVDILRARGIEGVFCPVAGAFRPELFESVREAVCTVALCDYRAGQWLDVVCCDYYHNLEIALSLLDQRGVTRIGLLLDQDYDQASGGLVRSRYLSFQQDSVCLQNVPHFQLQAPASVDTALLQWWNEYRPAAVVCGGRAAAAAALAVLPPDVTVVCLESTDLPCLQVDSRSEVVAMFAVDRLVSKVQGRDLRVGEATQRSFIKGVAVVPRTSAPLPLHSIAV